MFVLGKGNLEHLWLFWDQSLWFNIYAGFFLAVLWKLSVCFFQKLWQKSILWFTGVHGSKKCLVCICNVGYFVCGIVNISLWFLRSCYALCYYSLLFMFPIKHFVLDITKCHMCCCFIWKDFKTDHRHDNNCAWYLTIHIMYA